MGMIDLNSSFLILFASLSLLLLFRFGLLGSISYTLLWKVFPAQLSSRKLSRRQFWPGQIHSEIWHSIFTLLIFSIVVAFCFYGPIRAHTQIYLDVGEFGWLYFFSSIFVALLLHDFYFYFTHRWMHQSWFFRHFHHVHHRSASPNPWSSLNYHPVEALQIILFFPIFVFSMPMHPLALVGFGLLSNFANTLGHCGYDLLPKRTYSSWLYRHFNHPFHHNFHHTDVHCNFSLYTNYLDRLFKTLVKDYDQKCKQHAILDFQNFKASKQ